MRYLTAPLACLFLAGCMTPGDLTPSAPVYVGAVVLIASPEGTTGVSADGSVGADSKLDKTVDTAVDPEAVGSAVKNVVTPIPTPRPPTPEPE